MSTTSSHNERAAFFGNLTEQSSPEAAAPSFAAMRELFGFVPNLALALAVEPAVLGSYVSMLGALGSTTLSPVAQQVALVAASSANAAAYGIAIHSTLAAKLGAPEHIVKALREGEPLADPQLEAVRRFASAIASNRTQVSDSDIHALTAAGFDRRAAVAIAFAVASKTLANAVAHLAQPDIDEAFIAKA